MNPDKIRDHRRRMGLNRSDFGKLIGVSGRTVEKYELGTVQPSAAVLMHLRREVTNVKPCQTCEHVVGGMRYHNFCYDCGRRLPGGPKNE